MMAVVSRVEKDDDDSDVVVKMPSDASLNPFQICISYFAFPCGLLHRRFNETPRDPLTRLAANNVHRFLVAQMLPEAVGRENDELVAGSERIHSTLRVGTHHGSFERLWQPKPCSERLVVVLGFLQVEIPN